MRTTHVFLIAALLFVGASCTELETKEKATDAGDAGEIRVEASVDAATSSGDDLDVKIEAEGEREDENEDEAEDADDKPSTAAPAPAPAPTPTPAPSGAKSYTMADVQAHATASSCWSAVNGSVYDLTPWIGQHPGGPQAIASLCGKDGSAAFSGQHGGQQRPASELAGFKIGALK